LHAFHLQEKDQGQATMDNYYNSASPQELRYRDVLGAISALGSEAKDLADELDHAVWQVVNRAVDAAVMEHDRQILTNIARQRPATGRFESAVAEFESDRRRIERSGENAETLTGR
jgi:hypothetical protein